MFVCNRGNTPKCQDGLRTGELGQPAMFVYKTAGSGVRNAAAKLLLDSRNFVYQKHSNIRDRTYWRCILRKTCKAKYSTLNDRLIEFRGFHDHEPTFCEESMIHVDTPYPF